MPGSERYPAEILALIGAIAVEHSEADFLLTFHLGQIYCREMDLGWQVFGELFFAKKVELLRKAIKHFMPEADEQGFLDRSEYRNTLDLLSRLKETGERRNDLMHGIAQIEAEGDLAVLRRPNKRGAGLKLDEDTLNRVLNELKTLPGEIALHIIRIEKDLRDRQASRLTQFKGSKIQISTRALTGRIGNRTFKEFRSARKVTPPGSKD